MATGTTPGGRSGSDDGEFYQPYGPPLENLIQFCERIIASAITPVPAFAPKFHLMKVKPGTAKLWSFAPLKNPIPVCTRPVS